MPDGLKRGYVRLFGHVMLPTARYRRVLSAEVRERIEAAIAEGSHLHTGLVRVVFESALAPEQLRAGVTARERAMKVFSDLAVWDTEDNNGVLLYVLLADHAIEIVADRAASRQVPASEWAAICEALALAFAQRRHLDGTLRAIDAIHRVLARGFPVPPAGPATSAVEPRV